jgi:soluble lytic murein transglycosylase-like protein
MKIFKALFTIAILLAPLAAGAAPIYVFREKDGTIRFTDRTPPADTEAKVFTAHAVNFSYYRGNARYSFSKRALSSRLFLKLYETAIKNAARENAVDPALIKAVIHAESAFNPGAISRKGAVGLMQLMPGTARDLGVRAHVAEENIDGGVRYLAYLLKQFGGNLSNAVAAYNAGEEAVRKYNGIPPYSETQEYVRRVLALKESYGLHG